MKFGSWRVVRLLIATGLVVGTSLAASAQQPTSEQISAIRASCRSDFMAQCTGVKPGTKDALECLKRNAGKVSPPCKAALDAVGPPPTESAAPAPAPEKPAPASAAAAPPPPPQDAARYVRLRQPSRAARRDGGAGCFSSAGACGRRRQEAAIATGRSRARCVPLRLRRALPGRKAGRLCGAALPASQRRGAVSAMPRRRDGHG